MHTGKTVTGICWMTGKTIEITITGKTLFNNTYYLDGYTKESKSRRIYAGSAKHNGTLLYKKN